MNIFAEETLEGKFDKNIGIFKLEERIRKGEAKISDAHFKAYRPYRPAAFLVWCGLFQEAVANYFLMNGRITKDKKEKNRILWINITEDEWDKIRRMCKKLIGHKIWIDRGSKVSDAFGQTRPDFFKKFFEQGMIGEEKVLDQPINVQFISSGIWESI
jgi:hypothetical protein